MTHFQIKSTACAIVLLLALQGCSGGDGAKQSTGAPNRGPATGTDGSENQGGDSANVIGAPGYPDWFTAANFPQYPGASVFEADDSQVTIDTTPTAEPSEVAAFFSEEMKKLGWSSDSPITGTLIANVDFQKDGATVKLIVAKQMDGDAPKPTRATLIKLP
jgi:hypothetical protein